MNRDVCNRGYGAHDVCGYTVAATPITTIISTVLVLLLTCWCLFTRTLKKSPLIIKKSFFAFKRPSINGLIQGFRVRTTVRQS